MMETSEHFGDARGTRANAQQEWLPINLYRERSAFHISHNHERRCTCLFVHLFMQKLTIDSWEVDPVWDSLVEAVIKQCEQTSKMVQSSATGVKKSFIKCVPTWTGRFTCSSGGVMISGTVQPANCQPSGIPTLKIQGWEIPVQLTTDAETEDERNSYRYLHHTLCYLQWML